MRITTPNHGPPLKSTELVSHSTLLALAGWNPWEWNIKTDEMILSPQWCRGMGFCNSKVVHHIDFWDELRHPEDVLGVDSALRRHFARKTKVYECFVRLRRGCGEYIWIIDRGKVVEWDKNNKPLRMIGVNIDVSERKSA